jgi:glyoxylase-like metal-dependent hydrolase (beta-lactamase superfamily II)
MTKTCAATVLVLAVMAAPAAGQDAKTVIDEASRAMGITGLNAITYSGTAAHGNFGQSRTISFGLASTTIRNYTRTIDFRQPASYATGDGVPPGASGAAAAPAPAAAGRYEQTITAATPAWAQQLEIWVTPWGFLLGAAAHDATVRARRIDGSDYKVVTWAPSQKAPSGQPYTVVGYINAQNLVERVETWVEHPVLGDLHVEMTYSEYRDFSGVKAPGRISQKQIGMETFVAALGQVRANPPDLAQLMAPAAASGGAAIPAAAAAPAASERLADGVYRIGGDYVSLAVELKDGIVVLEAGQSEARGLAGIAETKRLFPNKRIKYVVNTHPHFDHLSGLPPFVAEGITILTDDNSKYFAEQALASPRTLLGDALAKSRKKPKVEGVIDKMVLGDASRRIELHHIGRLEHSDAMLIAYLPNERILFTADFAVAAPGQPASPSIVTLAQNIERLQLDFDRHVTVHASDRGMTRAELVALAKPAN